MAEGRGLRAQGAEGREQRAQEAGSRKQEAESRKQDAENRSWMQAAWVIAHGVMLNLNGARDTTVWRIQEKVFYTDAESRVIRYPALRKVPPQGR